MAIVPAAVLLTVSFFVLVVLRKIEEKGLRVFGYAVLGFLWLAALVVFSGAVYKIAQSSCVKRCKMPQAMKMDCMPQMMKKDCMPQMMKKDSPMAMAIPEKTPAARDQNSAGMPECAGNQGIVAKKAR